MLLAGNSHKWTFDRSLFVSRDPLLPLTHLLSAAGLSSIAQPLGARSEVIDQK